ncbi:hypothetical protein FWH58_00265 [Candidatus Saccharibacteria bacterium]|nr:hypothetical protein [Candidatus Saccharibacteria bacterium]
MAKKLKKQSSFKRAVAFAKRHRVSMSLIFLFFLGFISTGLAYAAVTGELRWFGTTAWLSQTNVDITGGKLRDLSNPGDSLSVSMDGKTIVFHLEFEKIDTPKWIDFCLTNNGAANVLFSTPTVSPPTDPNVTVIWPALAGVTLNVGQTVCNTLTQVQVYYTAMPTSGPYSATMDMSINYEQI